MMSDVLVNTLPCEVLEQILENENLRISDVISFALTCKQLYWTVTTSNKLWRTKFLQRWPFLQEAFDNQVATDGKENPNWRVEIRERILCSRRLVEKLSRMSAKYYGKQELSVNDMKEYDPLFLPEHGARPLSYHYLTDELIRLIEEPITGSNLTHKHYAYKVVRYLKQTHLAKEWEKFLALPVERQTMERGAIIVAQWSQPEKRVSAQKVSEMLDSIAQQTRELVAEKYPNIPINLVPRSEIALWKNENLYDNQWSPENSRLIVSTLCEIMFNKLGYHGNSEMYYSSINSFIDQVLIYRRGIPITLAIVFESVARRLGVHCEPVSFPLHFLLRWKERYIPRTKGEEVESYYIDVFNGGQFLTWKNCSGIAGATRCPIKKYNIHQATSAVKVVQRMAINLEVAGRQRTQLNGRAARLRSALELLHLVKPHDTNTILHLARFYMLHQMDVTELIESLNDMLNAGDEEEESRGQAKHILQMLEDYEKRIEVNSPTPKKRTPEVQYAVGMIMTDRLHNQCVITGWDAQCDRALASDYTLQGEACDRLAHGTEQPFYHIYVEDGSCRYAPQETLLRTSSPAPVNHHEIGRYFCGFMGSYYLANEEKAREYPEDVEFLNKMHSIFYSPDHFFLCSGGQ